MFDHYTSEIKRWATNKTISLNSSFVNIFKSVTQKQPVNYLKKKKTTFVTKSVWLRKEKQRMRYLNQQYK